MTGGTPLKIHGLQKMTLLDYPGHVACTVFLGGCDLRCPYCHNYELAVGGAQPVMDDQEFLSFLKKRKGLLDGVAITGGEPCLHPDLPDFIQDIRAFGFLVKLDTNGLHPQMLRRLLENGLVDYVAMDIKNSPARYAETAGTDSVDLDLIRESIQLIRSLAPSYEFRTTVVRELHGPEDFEQIGELISGAKSYYLQCFTDRDSVPFAGFHAPSVDELQSYAEIMRRHVRSVQLRGVDL